MPGQMSKSGDITTVRFIFASLLVHLANFFKFFSERDQARARGGGGVGTPRQSAAHS
jgi:hypothetical protein